MSVLILLNVSVKKFRNELLDVFGDNLCSILRSLLLEE